MTTSRADTRKSSLWKAIFILVILAAILELVMLFNAPRPSQNALAIGGESKVDSLEITRDLKTDLAAIVSWIDVARQVLT